MGVQLHAKLFIASQEGFVVYFIPNFNYFDSLWNMLYIKYRQIERLEQIHNIMLTCQDVVGLQLIVPRVVHNKSKERYLGCNLHMLRARCRV